VSSEDFTYIKKGATQRAFCESNSTILGTVRKKKKKAVSRNGPSPTPKRLSKMAAPYRVRAREHFPFFSLFTFVL
jgi:hypothetical protein